MKKIVLVVLLLVIAGIAGVVRSHSKNGGRVWPIVINADKQSAGNARDEIRKSFDLVPARALRFPALMAGLRLKLPIARQRTFTSSAWAKVRKF